MQQFTRFLFVLFCFVSYFAILLARLLYMFRSLLRCCFCFFLYGNVVLSLNISLSRVSQCSIFRCPFFSFTSSLTHVCVCLCEENVCLCDGSPSNGVFFFISVSVCLWVNSVVFFLFFWCMLLIEFAFAVWVFLALATVLYWMNYNRVKRIFALLPPSLSFSHILVGCSFYSVALIKYQHQDLLK